MPQAFPEVLDLLASTDESEKDKIEHLREALSFLCTCVTSLRERDQHLHTSVHEWIIAPLVHHLTLQASVNDRNALGQLLAMLVKGYQVPHIESLLLNAVASTKVRMSTCMSIKI